MMLHDIFFSFFGFQFVRSNHFNYSICVKEIKTIKGWWFCCFFCSFEEKKIANRLLIALIDTCYFFGFDKHAIPIIFKLFFVVVDKNRARIYLFLYVVIYYRIFLRHLVRSTFDHDHHKFRREEREKKTWNSLDHWLREWSFESFIIRCHAIIIF